jgi:hypothetical protein
MVDAPGITVNELKKRMDAGEDFHADRRSQSSSLGGIGHHVARSDPACQWKNSKGISPRISKDRPVIAYCT